MAGRPVGTVTMLFTDIEGSTRLLHELGVDTYADLLGTHHELVRDAVSSSRGVEIKTEGDSFFVVFTSASDALCAAADAQRALAAQAWPNDVSVRVRMGVHTGDVQLSGGEYVGMDVHRAARISAAAHGGQVLLSEATRSVAETMLPAGVSIRDLGEHMLKDIELPEHLFQLVIDGLAADFPPPRAVATRFDLLPADMSSFIGREEELRSSARAPGGDASPDAHRAGRNRARRGSRSSWHARVAADYEDGVAFVPLAPITDPGLVPSTIRQALGIPEQLGTAATETLIERLKDRELLIVLDNFEQVVAAASTVSALLEAIPGLTFVVTSRVALKITGEQEYAVPPLSVPSDSGHNRRRHALALGRSGAFCPPGARSACRLRAHARERAGRRRDLRPAGWPAARHRARGLAHQAAAAAGDPRTALEPAQLPAVDGGGPDGPTADAARRHRLELQPPDRARPGVVPTTRDLRRRLAPRRGRARRQRGRSHRGGPAGRCRRARRPQPRSARR